MKVAVVVLDIVMEVVVVVDIVTKINFLSKENMNKLNGLDQLRNWCAAQGLIYIQWYPYRRCSGYYIENPSEEALEKFYENVRASDPMCESFVLILGQIETYGNLNMKMIDEYIKEIIIPRLL